MARPKINKALRKNHVISFRLKTADYTRLAHAAAVADMRVNDYIRALSLSSSGKVTMTLSKGSNPALLMELNRIGTNLNQLAKRANMSGRISPLVPELCQRINQIIEQSITEEND